MLLSHWSDRPYLGHIYSHRQNDGRFRSTFDKPCGFWVSVDAPEDVGDAREWFDWQDWCLSNWPERLADYRHRVHLAPGAKIWHACPSDVRARYGRLITEGFLFGDVRIAWEEMARDYQGIIIAPYAWKFRMSENWYYTWDCASGCIWDASAIKCVEPCEEVVRG